MNVSGIGDVRQIFGRCLLAGDLFGRFYDIFLASRVRRGVLVLTGALCCSLTASSAGEMIAIYGIGAGSCGALTAAYEEGPPSQGVEFDGRTFSAKSNLYAQWLSGFFSAHNSLTRDNLFGGIDIEGLIEWVRGYCAENPLMLVNAAAFTAISEHRAQSSSSANEDRR